MKIQKRLDILLYKEHELWVAQCLQFDISAQANTLEDAKYEFQKVFIGQIAASIENGIEPLKGIPKAPAIFARLYEKATELKSEPFVFELAKRARKEIPRYQIPSEPMLRLCAA